jgi:phosphoglycerol transferase MdoB-like AlkP superfamily enzyme
MLLQSERERYTVSPLLAARWKRTRRLVDFAGSVGLVISVLIFLIGMRMLAWLAALPFQFAIVAMTFFAAAIVLTPSIHLIRQARAIRRAMNERTEHAFSEVLLYQRRYWSYVGVLTLLMIPLTLLAVIGMVIE